MNKNLTQSIKLSPTIQKILYKNAKTTVETKKKIIKETQKNWKLKKKNLKKKSKTIKTKNAFLLVLPIEEISLWTELSSPPRFRIQGGLQSAVSKTLQTVSFCKFLQSVRLCRLVNFANHQTREYTEYKTAAPSPLPTPPPPPPPPPPRTPMPTTLCVP